MITQSMYRIPKAITFLTLILMCFSVFPATAVIFSEDGSNHTESELYNLTNNTKPVELNRTAIFFYDPECNYCKPAYAYMEKYLSEHPGSQVEVVNLSQGQEAEERLNDHYIAYNREWMNIPVMFIGPVGLEGTDAIINNFESVYNWYTTKE